MTKETLTTAFVVLSEEKGRCDGAIHFNLTHIKPPRDITHVYERLDAVLCAIRDIQAALKEAETK